MFNFGNIIFSIFAIYHLKFKAKVLMNCEVMFKCMANLINLNNFMPFYAPLQHSNYGQNALINRLMQFVNQINVDLYSCVSLNDFSYYLKN